MEEVNITVLDVLEDMGKNL